MTRHNPADYSIIGIGASASGLEALENLFRGMEPSPKISFVVVQHLSPDYKSMMVELLSKHTNIPIQQATHEMKVLPGNIYLIPPKKNITIENGFLNLADIQHTPGNLNLPIDNFLITLAQDQGDKAIAIILSGTGSDGTRGIRKIKERGGMVIVQEENEAKFDGMPRSAIATGLVDFILPVDKMATTLLRFVDHPLTVREIEPLRIGDEDHYDSILSQIKKVSGVDFSFYKSATVTRRISRRMSLNQIDKLSEYTEYIEKNPKEIEILQRELLIGVTNFFRDIEAFTIIEEKTLPKLFKNKQKRDQVRIWVTACSTGEEAYSLAILVKEYMKKNNIWFDVKIFATDVDPFALKTAGTGSYTDSIAADISEERLKNYFIKKGNIYQISPEIREMVIFAPQNLIKDPPFSRIDLISCRNFMIYVQPETQKKIIQMFHFSLITNGVLFLGSSESLGDLSGYFEEIDAKWKIFLTKPGNLNYSLNPISPENGGLSYKNIYSNSISSKSQKNDKTLDKLFTGILEKYLPPCAIVNETFQIMHVVGNINPFVKMQSGKVNFEITSMVDRSIKIALTTGLRKCFFDNKEVVYKNIALQEEFYKKTINLIIQPVPNDDNLNKLAVVIFEESQNQQTKLSLYDKNTESYSFDENVHQRIIELEQELEFNRENLQATIEQLETSNEELQATNEELLAANEELQSTNEELQSVNEELVTLNSEHQGKIMELTELNNDINNLLSNTDIGVVFLDDEMKIRKFTPAAQKIINLMPSDKGRPISHISHIFKESISLHEESKKVLESLIPIEKELFVSHENKIEQSFLIRFLPYRTLDKRVNGIVISIIDITELKRTDDFLRNKFKFQSDILEIMRESIITMDRNFKIKSWNLFSGSLFGYTESEVMGGNFFDLLLPNISSDKRKSITEHVNNSETYSEEREVVHKNGTNIKIYIMMDLIRNKDGDEESIIVISRPI
ncbi:MAG: PAS domain-containing protein [Leptospira sp.]|nr:PAS domain-containing protein [Leptospira sp.]